MNRLGWGFAVAALATGCRFGGPTENPFATTGFGSGGAASQSLSSSPESGPATDEPSFDAGASEAPTLPMTAPDAASPLVDSGPVALCQAPASIPVCDPIRNTGCFPLTQCDVDPQQTAPTGRCIFLPPPGPADGGSCTTNPFGASCPATFTCVNGSCQKLCYCDSDCAAGTCCAGSVPAGPSVFKTCEPCP